MASETQIQSGWTGFGMSVIALRLVGLGLLAVGLSWVATVTANGLVAVAAGVPTVILGLFCVKVAVASDGEVIRVRNVVRSHDIQISDIERVGVGSYGPFGAVLRLVLFSGDEVKVAAAGVQWLGKLEIADRIDRLQLPRDDRPSW